VPIGVAVRAGEAKPDIIAYLKAGKVWASGSTGVRNAINVIWACSEALSKSDLMNSDQSARNDPKFPALRRSTSQV
jgi:ribosomal protein S5